MYAKRAIQLKLRFVLLQSPGVMPFYGDSGAGFRPAAGFGNTVWHQGVAPVGAVAVETSAAPWPPQQFIQQIPAPNQLEELRYHTQYSAAAPYHPQPGNWRNDSDFDKFIWISLFVLSSKTGGGRCIFVRQPIFFNTSIDRIFIFYFIIIKYIRHRI